MALMLADVDQIRGYVYGSATQADADKAAVDFGVLVTADG